MRYLSFSFILLLVLLIGCGGTSGKGGGGCCTVPGINVVVVSPTGPGAVDDNQGLTLPITVEVTNDSSKAGVTWTVAPEVAGGPTGTLSNQQPSSVTYTPPAGVTSSAQVTITATSVSDPTRAAVIPVTVYPPLTAVTTSSDLATAFRNTSYTCIQLPISNSVNQIPCSVKVAGGLGPYTWSLGNTFLPTGLQLAAGLDQFSTEIAGIPTTPGIYPFSLTATDATGNTTTFSLNINVAPAQLSVTTPTLMVLIPGVPYGPVQLSASGALTPPYKWSLAGGSLPTDPSTGKPVLTISPSGVISGTPPQNFNQGQFALLVTDSTSQVPAQAIFPTPAPSNGSIITLGVGTDNESFNPCSSAIKTSVAANVPYAFLFAGFDQNGPVTFSGSFTADASGNLTGVEDIVRSSGAQVAQPLVSGSSILFNDVNSGCLTLSTSGSSSQFRLAPTTLAEAGYTDGRIIEFDDTTGTGTRGSGYFRIQDSTAFTTPVNGPLALRLSGWDASTHHFAMAGTASAQTGSLAAVSADTNDGGTFSGPLTGGGTIGVADSNGRGIATLSTGATSFDLVYYVVDANHLILNSTQAASSGRPLVTGEAVASTGPFSSATLSNSHIYRFGGSIPGSPDVGVGVLHFDGLGGVSGTNYERTGGTATSTTLSAQYTIDPTSGRFTFSGTGAPVVGYAVPSASGVTGYLVGTGASAASGTMEFQTNTYPPGYQFGPILNTYGVGTEEMLDPQSTVIAGIEQVNTNAALTPLVSYLDSSGPTGLAPLQEFQLFKYTWSADGSGTFGGNTLMVTNQSKFFYIDTSPLNGHPVVIVGQRQQ